ncbi:hypothetical protein [Natronococcus sp.]|uniref:hypothetical protein n=1 Tax=Natronococcus sp. TaxID=35747 RepID=UPI003A4E28E9
MVYASSGPPFVNLTLDDPETTVFQALFGLLLFPLVVARFERAVAVISDDEYDTPDYGQGDT